MTALLCQIKLLKHGFSSSVSCTPLKRLSKKNRTELFENHQIDLSCTPSKIVIVDSVAARLARFSDIWYTFFHNALNFVLEEIAQNR